MITLKHGIITLWATLLGVTATWAQTNENITVRTEEELQAAIADGSKDIILFQSIALSETLEIPTGKTININLSSKTLNRSLDHRDYDNGGQVVTVRQGATLNLSQGILTGGWGGDSGGILNDGGNVNLTNITIMGCKGDNRGGGIVNRYGSTLTMTGGSIKDNTSYDIKVHDSDTSGGGGIFNAEGATATLKNVSITGNEAKVTGGGGICNWGSLTLDGCTIQNNTSKAHGSGVWCKNSSTLTMRGAVNVSSNIMDGSTTNNVYLQQGAVIAVDAELTGSSIGIALQAVTDIFTQGYSEYNSGTDPATIFISDNAPYYIATLSENEACISPGTNVRVKTESELRTALKIDGVGIELANDLILSNSTLEIAGSKTVTIDLNGYTLDRKLTQRGEGGGQVFTVRSGATLNLSNGTVKGGWAGDSGGLLNHGTANLTDVIVSNCNGDNKGGGITNYGTLSIGGGSIKDNVTFGIKTNGSDPAGGGGLFNAEGATATLTGVSITGNKAEGFIGGGICNYGALTIDGCDIQDNKAGTVGGGMWSNGSATLNIQGETTIMVNTANENMINNVSLADGAIINVTGALAGSQIGISMTTPGTFTNGFTAKSGLADPSHVFLSDMADNMTLTLQDSEAAMIQTVLPGDDVYYVDRQWNWNKSRLESSIKYLTEQIGFNDTPTSETQYKLLTSSSSDVINLGKLDEEAQMKEFYVVKGEVNVNKLNIKGARVCILLCDGCKLTLGNNIVLNNDQYLYIYDQGSQERMGKMHASDRACIGDDNYTSTTLAGNIVIHGGDISLKGHDHEAAIGGHHQSGIRSIYIFSGKIRAEGGSGAAGIGSGHGDDNYGIIQIFGGIIDAIGGVDTQELFLSGGGPGIGGGYDCQTGQLNIYGGYITATSPSESAGIGCGQYADFSNGAGHINISGGTIRAFGGDHAAGIGGGDGITGAELYIYGGHIEAYGGADAAGIGGGEGANGGSTEIKGGYVYAKGGWEYGAGIGGGQDGPATSTVIHGGVVIAEAGEDETGCRAIGPGSGDDDYGYFWLDPKMMVTSERIFTAEERANGCQYRTRVRVEPCYHPDHTYIVTGTGVDDTHQEQCIYCSIGFKAEKHKFTDGVCTVCGVSETTYSVDIYLPVASGSEGLYDAPETHQVVDNSKIFLPTAPEDRTPEGLEFAGWLAATPEGLTSYITQPGETLLEAGSQYTVNDNVSFTARYQPINLTLYDDKYNGETIHRNNGKTVTSITLDGRTLKKNGCWNTLCLPFDCTVSGSILEGCELMELDVEGMYSSNKQTGFDTETGTLYLYFANVTNIKAGKPYIIRWTSGDDIESPVFSDVTINHALYRVHSQDGRVSFGGVYNPRNLAADDRTIYFFGSDNNIYYPSEATTLNSFRNFFKLSGIEAGQLNNIVVNFDEETGVRTVHSSSSEALRRAELGTQFPVHSYDGYYTLDGRKLNGIPTQKGLYIHNGTTFAR